MFDAPPIGTNGNALSVKFPTTALCKRFECELVADPLNEHDRTCGEWIGRHVSHPHAHQRYRVSATPSAQWPFQKPKLDKHIT